MVGTMRGECYEASDAVELIKRAAQSSLNVARIAQSALMSRHQPPSFPAKAGNPVRRGFSV
jgi:hypothetical protein